MRRNLPSLAAGSVLTALLAGCTLSSPDQLPGTPPLTGDTHFTLLQTTDIHDHANGDGPMVGGAPGPVGSYARIAAYVNAVRAAQTAAEVPVVLVDSGDWTMGTLYDLTVSQQPLSTFFLDTLRYDCTTLGNHEFDYTPKGLATILKTSRSAFGFHTPIVASNMVLNGNTDLAPYVGTTILPTYTETLPTGLKVGFIGLMGTDAAAAAPASAPVTFTDYSKGTGSVAAYASVQNLVDDLRKNQGCNVVIALNHAGTNPATGGYTGEDIDLAAAVKGIDVIASGHTHNPFGADGHADHPVTNGTWTTQIICAGAYSTNVSRLDLTYHFAAGNVTVDAASNLAMDGTAATDFDPAQSVFVGKADAGLNYSLGTLFSTFFPDYDPTDVTKGVYHLVGATAQTMQPNDINPVLSPNGLGNLCADADRNVPNGIIQKVAQALLKAGWTGDPADPNLPAIMAAANLANYDLTLYTAAVVPTGVIRDTLDAGAPISFANVYQVLPLGISPDSSQALPVGYPMMSAYLTLPDLKTLCALQLVGQSNLVGSEYYLNLSGISYDFNTTPGLPLGISPLETYFKEATAAGVLQVTSQKYAGGSVMAGTALGALGMLGTDSGAALGAAAAAGNPYAQAMVSLDDPSSPNVNLAVLGQVALAAAEGTAAVNTMIVSAAAAAINNVYGFVPNDPACVLPPEPTQALDGSKRYRVAADLYGVLMMGALQSQFGISISPYADASSSIVLSGADLATAMNYRINLTPGQPLVELKEWEALLEYLVTFPAVQGLPTIPSAYASTPSFADFPTDGAAVTVRNASYPLPALGGLMTTLGTLSGLPIDQ